jgi:hypothetical protein
MVTWTAAPISSAALSSSLLSSPLSPELQLREKSLPQPRPIPSLVSIAWEPYPTSTSPSYHQVLPLLFSNAQLSPFLSLVDAAPNPTLLTEARQRMQEVLSVVLSLIDVPDEVFPSSPCADSYIG